MGERKWFDIDLMPNSDDCWIVVPPAESGTSEPIGSEDGYATLAEAVAVAEAWAKQRNLHLPYLVTIRVAQDIDSEPSVNYLCDPCEETSDD